MGNGVNTGKGGRAWRSVQGAQGRNGEILKRKEKNEAAEQKFPGQRGCGIIFSERFEMLHCLKLKWMWDRILCNDPEGRRDSGKKDKQETKTNSKTLGKGRRWLTPTPAWETLPASSLGDDSRRNCSRARLVPPPPPSPRRWKCTPIPHTPPHAWTSYSHFLGRPPPSGCQNPTDSPQCSLGSPAFPPTTLA